MIPEGLELAAGARSWMAATLGLRCPAGLQTARLLLGLLWPGIMGAMAYAQHAPLASPGEASNLLLYQSSQVTYSG